MGYPIYRDRIDAGKALARSLEGFTNRPDVLVLALPRGGVPVADEVARALQAPLDVLVVRKLGVPGHEEYAMGALASGGVKMLDDRVVKQLDIPAAAIESVIRSEQRELERRERLYRGELPPLDVRRKAVLLVDDGLATGSTMRAAVEALRRQHPAQVIVAVPVAAADACEAVRRVADEVICARTPERFRAVGSYYEDFSQTSDDEVRELLARAHRPAA